MPYYLLDIVDDQGSGLDMGYEAGLVDKYNPAPEGAVVFNTEKQVNAAIKKVQNRNNKATLKALEAPGRKLEVREAKELNKGQIAKELKEGLA